MGLFSRKSGTLAPPRSARAFHPPGQPQELKQGTTVAIDNPDPQFIERARSATPKQPRIGHVIRIALWADKGHVLVVADGQVVGTMRADLASLYLPELRWIQAQGKYGVTDAYVKPEGAKSPHVIAINWSVQAADGGIV